MFKVILGTYTLDTATPLTRLLDKTTGPDTTFTLHGLGLVAQSDGSATEYFSADGLGTVRQLTDSTGDVLLNQTFDPYGNPYVRTGPGDTRFGFTGEQVDGNGLVYLRARYYQPEMGRFLNVDPSRQERNPYQYAMSNPVLHTDPSGLTVDCGWWESGCEANSQPGGRVNDDHRNLTFWLVEVMKTNAQSPEVAEIRELNRQANLTGGLALLEWLSDNDQVMDCSVPVALGMAYLDKLLAQEKFVALVGRNKRWDFKDEISKKLGDSVRLCDTSECRWYNFDVVANIHFGYIGRAAGWTGAELHIGAGQAQKTDDPDTSKWWAFGDEPADYAAIEVGIRLYQVAKPSQLEIRDFGRVLSGRYDKLKGGISPTTLYFQYDFPVDPLYGPKFPVDYFNDKG